MVTSAVEAVHGEFEIVQRSTIGPVPLVCVKVELPLDALLKVPAPPLTTDQAPVPTEGVLPPRLAVVPDAQIVCGPPTVAVVGAALTVTIVLAAFVQLPELVLVTVKVYVPPAAVLTLEMDGLRTVEEKPLGPVHE